jgi:hypothetical protein
MKTKNLFNSIIGLFLIVLVFNSCQKDDNDNPNNFPTTPEQIAEAVENTELIVDEGGEIIEDAISSAFYSDDLIDPNQIAEQIKSIEGVESAEATSTGTGIVIKQKDGTYTNLFIVTQDNERLFIENTTKSASKKSKTIVQVDENPVLPNGDGKALILAPFQKSLNKNLNQLEQLLETAGFEVDTYEDENASLDRFNGNFLNNYDVIFIDTHGAANFRTRGGDISTILMTGEEYTTSKTESLSDAEQKAIATGGHDGKTYFAISIQWLNITTSEDFPNSWFFASACETAMTDNGSSSLSEGLLNLGVIGYNGYDATINSGIAGPIAEKMMARFSSGLTFNDASDEVRNDWGLLAKSWLLRIVAGNSANVDLFDNNKEISDPFYLIDPDDVVGVAEVIPEAGPVGTEVVFQVVINDKFVSQVASIEFDIDNTGEHLTMSKISNNTWQRDGLTAPTADSYPRIDTFTFSAFDEDGNLIGQGSATFSILEEASTKSTSIKKAKYYGK